MRAGKALGSGVGTAAQRVLSLFWMLLAAPGQWLLFLFHLFRNVHPLLLSCPLILCVLYFSFSTVKAGKGLLWFLATGWYQLVSLMSLLNVFFLTR